MEKLKRVTMSVSHENPDAQVNFKSIGTGKDQREAAVFALEECALTILSTFHFIDSSKV